MVHLTDWAFDLQLVRPGMEPKPLKRRNPMGKVTFEEAGPDDPIFDGRVRVWTPRTKWREKTHATPVNVHEKPRKDKKTVRRATAADVEHFVGPRCFNPAAVQELARIADEKAKEQEKAESGDKDDDKKGTPSEAQNPSNRISVSNIVIPT